MTDHLPEPMAETGAVALGERASATSARRMAVRKAGAEHERPRRAAPKGLVDVQRWLVEGIVSDEAMEEFIANAKEVLRSSREVSFPEIADFSFARRAVGELR